MTIINMGDLVGKTIKSIDGLEKGSLKVTIYTEDCHYEFEHYQDCCESVDLEDYELDNDLTGALIVSAEEVIGEVTYINSMEQYTFYKIETNKGGLFMRWFGVSNGYYSTGVNIYKREYQ